MKTVNDYITGVLVHSELQVYEPDLEKEGDS